MKVLFMSLGTCLIAGGLLFGGYKWGYGSGQQRATDEAALGAHTTNCVFLTLASRGESDGDASKARDLRNRLLFASAMELDELIRSGRLDEAKAENAREVVQDVVNHYWLHPDSNSFFLRDRSLAQLEPKLTDLFQRYRATAQGLDGGSR